MSEIEDLKLELHDIKLKLEKIEKILQSLIKDDMPVAASRIGNFDPSDFTRLSIDNLSHSVGTTDQCGRFCGITYFGFKEQDQQTLFDKFLPKELHSHFKLYASNTDYDDLSPHLDSDIKTVINFYKSNGNRTVKSYEPAFIQFYENERNVEANETKYSKKFFSPEMKDGKYVVLTETPIKTYDKTSLTKAFAFTPIRGDIWVLDAQKIYSVNNNLGNLSCFSFQTSDLSYEEVINLYRQHKQD